MKRLFVLFALSSLVFSCKNTSNEAPAMDTTAVESTVSSSEQNTSQENKSAVSNDGTPKPLSWYCSKLLHQPASSVQSILGQATDCYNCTSNMGEIQYRDAVLDAMGTAQTLKIHYYDGVVTWLQYGSSMTYTEDERACR